MATFHPSVRLPYELRIRIWELTVEPRVVDLCINSINCWPRGRIGPPICYLVSTTPVPGVLQTCREARNLGLYQQTFSELAKLHGPERYIWANLDIDIISIGRTDFDEVEPAAPLIQRLMFERENTSESLYHFESHQMRMFVNTKEIYVVCADGMASWHGAATEEHYFPCGRENVFMLGSEDDDFAHGKEHAFQFVPSGRMIKGLDMDEILDRELRESYFKEEYEYWMSSYWTV